MARPDSKHRRYSTRSNAVRAARAAAKKALGPAFQAFEGPDYEIHPCSGPDGAGYGRYGMDHYYFRLRGPAAEGNDFHG